MKHKTACCALVRKNRKVEIYRLESSKTLKTKIDVQGSKCKCWMQSRQRNHGAERLSRVMKIWLAPYRYML